MFLRRLAMKREGGIAFQADKNDYRALLSKLDLKVTSLSHAGRAAGSVKPPPEGSGS